MAKRPRIKRILIALTSAALLLTLVLVALTLMITHRPAAYRPAPVSQPRFEQADKYSTDLLADFYNSLQRKEPFIVQISRRLLNEILLLTDDQPLLIGNLPHHRGFANPQFYFSPGVIGTMGMASYRGHSVVLTVRLQLSMTEDGDLHIALLPIKLGALGLPDWVLERTTEPLMGVLQKGRRGRDNHPREGKKKYNSSKELLVDLWEDWRPMLIELVDKKEITLDPTFRDEVRLVGVTVEEELLELMLEPLE